MRTRARKLTRKKKKELNQKLWRDARTTIDKRVKQRLQVTANLDNAAQAHEQGTSEHLPHTLGDDVPAPGTCNTSGNSEAERRSGGGGPNGAGDPIDHNLPTDNSPLHFSGGTQFAKPQSRKIVLPNNWTPRWYQRRAMGNVDAGIKRQMSVWHRRAGKDSSAANYTACAAHKRGGVYWHVLPTLKQARKSVWEGIDKSGRKIIDQAFPIELRKKTRDDDMMIEFIDGSIWQLVGGDSYDGLVGSNPIGIVASEFSLISPLFYDYVRPILRENGGWFWAIFTPRGRNHAYRLYERNKTNPAWYCETLTWRDTGVLTEADIQAERLEGMAEEKIRQEYECDFTAANVGAVFGLQMEALRKATPSRITFCPYDPKYPVETAWDIGHYDATAIWFLQRIPREGVRAIDYFCEKKRTLPYCANIVNSKPYSYSRHIFPHDMSEMEYGSGVDRVALARQHGIMVTIAPKLKKDAQIEAARALIPTMTFDAEKCNHGILALEHHHFEEDEERKAFGAKPVHDWSSDPADALMTYAATPPAYGIVPGWARDMVAGTADWRTGHNGGPPLDGEFDPLAAFRG